MYRKVLTLLNIYVEKKDKQPENGMYIKIHKIKLNMENLNDKNKSYFCFKSCFTTH